MNPILYALVLIALAIRCHAGVSIIQTLEDLYEKHPVDTNIIRIEKGKIRVDLGSEPDTYQIYRGDLALLWTVNLKEKIYFQRTGKEAEAMRAEWTEGLGKMREQMEKLPPERRKEMHDKITKMAAEAKTTYRKIGDGGKVHGWPTEKYEGFRQNEKIAEEWVTDAGNLGMREADARALRDEQGYFDKYSSGWPGKDLDKGNGPANVTVKAIVFRDGKPMWRTEYVAVIPDTCPARLFELPPGVTLRVPH
jgi:hypothetical protein